MDTYTIYQQIKKFELPTLITPRKQYSLPLQTSLIVSLIGGRRTGKTYILYQTIKDLLNLSMVPKNNVLYINFENPEFIDVDLVAVEKILEYFEDELVSGSKGYLFLDEIQELKNWEKLIRKIYESKKFHIYITGSSSTLLANEIATSLRGRTLTFNIFPLTFLEYLDFIGCQLSKVSYSKLRKYKKYYFEFGGLPELVYLDLEILKLKYLESYLDLVIYKDLVDRHSIRDIEALKGLVYKLIHDTSCFFSTNKFFNSQTENKYFNSIQSLSDFLRYLLESNYFTALRKYSKSQVVKYQSIRKIAVFDHGLKNFVSSDPEKGKVLETIVVNLLLRNEFQLSYFREVNREIDIIAIKKHKMFAIQVCFELNEANSDRELSPFTYFNYKGFEKIVVTYNENVILKTKEGSKINIITFDKFEEILNRKI